MITQLRDLSEVFRMSADSCAGLFDCPNPAGTSRGRYCVAWGQPAAQMWAYPAVRPLGWSQDENTTEDGCEWFDTIAEAEAYIANESAST